MKKFKRSGLIALSLLLFAGILLLGCKSESEPADPIVSISNLGRTDGTGIQAPVKSQQVKTDGIIDTDQYSGSYTWIETLTENPVQAGEIFKTYTQYTALVTLTPKGKYTFNGIPSDFFKFPNAKVTNKPNSNKVSITFPSSGGSVNKGGIQGVLIPIIGDDVPDSTVNITATDQYTGSYYWLTSDKKFLEKHGPTWSTQPYIAQITLNRVGNFDFDQNYDTGGSQQYLFKVSGATVKWVSGSGGSIVLEASFETGTTGKVTLVDIDKVTLPVGGQPDPEQGRTQITSQFTYTYKWTPELKAGETFKYNEQYTATITLSPYSPTFTLDGVANDYFEVTGATKTNYIGSSNIVTALFDYTGKAPVTIRDISIPAPVLGGLADSNISIPSNGEFSAKYSWIKEPEKTGFEGTFAGEVQYTAVITLTPDTNFQLNEIDNKASHFRVAGATVSYVAGSNTVRATFPATDPAKVNLNTIGGVIAPVEGVVAVQGAVITETTQYTGTLAWDPAVAAGGKFAPAKAYTAKITLTAKAGYTFNGLAANFFSSLLSVDPSKLTSVTSPAGAGKTIVVSALFKATGNLPVSMSGVAGITAPKYNAVAVTSITSEVTLPEYTASISWSPTLLTGSKFDYLKVYTATITLTARTGYSFTGLTTGLNTVGGFFKVTGADSTDTTAIATNGNTATVKAVFPETGAKMYIALTFDDCFSVSDESNILSLLDVLDTYNAKATWFANSEMDQAYEVDFETMKNRINGRGDDLGNHAYDHYAWGYGTTTPSWPNITVSQYNALTPITGITFTGASPNKVVADTTANRTLIRNDFLKTQNLVLSKFGRSPTWFRHPYNDYSNITLSILAEPALNLAHIDAKHDSYDWAEFTKYYKGSTTAAHTDTETNSAKPNSSVTTSTNTSTDDGDPAFVWSDFDTTPCSLCSSGSSGSGSSKVSEYVYHLKASKIADLVSKWNVADGQNVLFHDNACFNTAKALTGVTGTGAFTGGLKALKDKGVGFMTLTELWYYRKGPTAAPPVAGTVYEDF